MSRKTDLELEMTILSEAEARPPFAMLWGIDAAEVPHNKFLHHLFEEHELGLILLRAMLAEVVEHLISPEDVESIVDQRFQESLGKKRRLDETLILQMTSGEQVTFIIELKVEAAEGEDQLADYRTAYEATKLNLGRRVEGLLVRFTEEPGLTQPTLTLSGFCKALESIIGREGRRVSSGAIHDHYRTCRALLARERVLLADPAQLMARESEREWLKGWQADNWRWTCDRLLRGVDAALIRDHGGKPDRAGRGVFGAGVSRDPEGAFLDFAVGGGERGLRSHNPGEEPGLVVLGARAFFKLRATRAGLRMEMQTLTESYPDSPPTERAARHSLWEGLAAKLQGWNQWEEPTRAPGPNTKSGCAAVRKLAGWTTPDQLAATAWAWVQEVLVRVATDAPS